MMKNGLFVGLVTLDILYLTDEFPERNQKVVATNDTIAAGGPATNAAVTFSYYKNQASILGAIGKHPLSSIIQSDLEACLVQGIDLDRDRVNSPPVSSTIITGSTGDRAVISVNAVKSQAHIAAIPPDILADVDIVLIDGHQMIVGADLAQQAKAKKIPVVVDGGSWKPGFEKVLGNTDYAIVSANFLPPGCQDQVEVFAYLQNQQIPHIALTNGEKPIQYLSKGKRGELPVPQIIAVDTLGAGDIFHGAFCHYILQTNFIEALSSSAKIAAFACQFLGTREWMQR
ncbi:MAG: sugar kinase [Oscillatoria sp. PMC 1068.18]|nr:sugar kinase [Oscillatoria sp. PMC 1076.18]MEC4990034.1 sugar kinase [Oscillatoria sp. PMC 1068.18]